MYSTQLPAWPEGNHEFLCKLFLSVLHIFLEVLGDRSARHEKFQQYKPFYKQLCQVSDHSGPGSEDHHVLHGKTEPVENPEEAMSPWKSGDEEAGKWHERMKAAQRHSCKAS
jgi:hypothetical protein